MSKEGQEMIEVCPGRGVRGHEAYLDRDARGSDAWKALVCHTCGAKSADEGKTWTYPNGKIADAPDAAPVPFPDTVQRVSRAVEAPFTPEQVAHLNEYQWSGAGHPFTCPNDGDASHDGDGTQTPLVATVRGWECPYCDYTQKWAHGFMADGSAIEMRERQLRSFKPEAVAKWKEKHEPRRFARPQAPKETLQELLAKVQSNVHPNT